MSGRWAIALWLILGPPSQATAEALGDLRTIRACVDANAPSSSSVLDIALQVRSAQGSVSESRMKLYWRRLPDGEQRVLFRFLAPEELFRTALLVRAREGKRPLVHLYLPDLGKARRVTSRSQIDGFLGRADLGLEEVRQLLSPLEGDDVRLVNGADQISGRAVWVVEEPGAHDGRYARIVTFLDREYCLPLRAEFYGEQGPALKLLRVEPEDVVREADWWVARRLVFEDSESGSQATLNVENVEIDIPLAPGLLTVRALEMGGLRRP